MGQLSENSSSDSFTLSEEPIFNDGGPLEIPTAPLIDISDDQPSQNAPPGNQAPIVDNVQAGTVVDQVGEFLSPLVRFGNLFERAYVRPSIALSLNALGVSPPIAQYLETPMTLAFLFTSLFFLVSILGSTSKEVLRSSVALFAYFVKRSFIFSFRLVKIVFESIIVFASISAVAAIGKAMLGFPIPNLPAGVTSPEQLSAHTAQAREQIEALRMYASRIEMRELAERLSQWKANIRGAAVTLKARFAEQKLWVKVVTIFSAYMMLDLIVGDIFHVLIRLVVHGEDPPLRPDGTLI
ncbi:hypothetical protein BKA70DRAFT_1433672 [Coprinopsis sp. MPI-PUGE-AT-0042]|nr:hypothetical protein BKA70DRAFT_1433672 [Coprinopsis sp. MPI-PUGE-AT-0042]